jgi:TolB-like protein
MALLAVAALIWLREPAATRDPRAPTDPIRSLAVLPLQNLSGDASQDYFAAGMTEVLISDLASITSLGVLSRTSVMRYFGERKLLPEIAQELGVDAIIEGSVLRAGDAVRITVQLIDARTDLHLWSQSYERDLTDVLQLQREVARAIARAVRLELEPGGEVPLAVGVTEARAGPDRRARLARLRAEPDRARLRAERDRLAKAAAEDLIDLRASLEVGTGAGSRGPARRSRPVNPEAYEAYLKGTFFLNKRGAANYTTAVELLKEAVTLDPEYALAWARLADGFT